MAEFERKRYSSGVSKTALGLGIAGTALGLNSNSNNGGGLFGNLFGNNQNPQSAAAQQIAAQGGYVTEKEVLLRGDIASKDSEIARLKAEKYADEKIREEVEPLKQRICVLETEQAVNSERDRGFRRYVESEFVHQPTASMSDVIVTCQQRGCSCGCNHNHCDHC